MNGGTVEEGARGEGKLEDLVAMTEPFVIGPVAFGDDGLGSLPCQTNGPSDGGRKSSFDVRLVRGQRRLIRAGNPDRGKRHAGMRCFRESKIVVAGQSNQPGTSWDFAVAQ